MALTIGMQLGSHEITALLGKGGMGEVYRARDLKLKREVAIKILPEEFSRDADRVNRFQREAEVLASLNHPNIAGIYDVEEAGGSRYLVLELVEGETLADRIARGPIPVGEAMRIALQICGALEAAHERGIIHRDLKPANIKLTDDGNVKVLDFGLAKAMESMPTSATQSNSPTLLSGGMAGMIVGTAAYMSPEQAKGRAVDRRTDIFAFGCVLYEMLTGKRTFDGDDVTDILGAVLRIEPDWSALPKNSPAGLQNLLRLCLEKNVKNRRSDATDLRLDIEQVLQESVNPAPKPIELVKQPFWKRAVLPIVAAVLAASTAALWITRPVVRAGHVVRYSYTLPKDQDFTQTRHLVLAISHDGSKLVYVANNQLYLKSISEVEAKPIPGTNQSPDHPMFSPDGQWIAFFVESERTLKKIPLAGGASVTVAENVGSVAGASWAANDQILIAPRAGIFRVPSGGGKPETVIAAKPDEAFVGPELLPNGQDLLFTVNKSTDLANAPTGLAARSDAGQIVVQNLQSGTRKVVVQAGSNPHYIPTGHLIYTIGGTVYAVPFDLKKLQVTAGPVPVLEGVRRAQAAPSATFLSLSDDGSLIWVAGSSAETARVLALVDRSGSRKALSLSQAGYDMPRISPDGKHLAVGIQDSKDLNIWIYDLDGKTSIRRLTFGGKNQSPAWTPDSKRIAFRSDRDGEGIYWQAADGSGVAERLIATDKGSIYDMPMEWAPDGKTLVFYIARAGGSTLWTFGLGGDRKPHPLVTSANNSRRSTFSPDGRWIAYSSNEEGAFSVYVQPFPATGAKYKISAKEFADSPLWTPDGKQIVFASANPSHLMSVDVQTTPSFASSKPKALPIEIENTQGRPYDITRDSKQFLVMQRPDESTTPEKTSPQINVVVNWFRELQERVPVK